MNSTYTFRILGLTSILTIFLFANVTAQSRYKHVPRVKVNIEQPVKTTRTSNIQKVENSSLSYIEPKMPVKAAIDTNKVPILNSVTAHNSPSVQKNKLNHRESPLVNEPKKPSGEPFINLFKRTHKLAEVKVAPEKTQVLSILWFILTLIIAVILIVLAIILLSVLAFSLYYIFFILGGVALVVAIVLLILVL